MSAEIEIRTVVDTNTILDFFVFQNPESLPLLEAIRDARVLSFASEGTLHEFADVISRPQFGLSPERQAEVLQEWRSLCRIIEPDSESPLKCKDPEDDKFLALAWTVRPCQLITKDRHLLKVRGRAKRFGISISGLAYFLI